MKQDKAHWIEIFATEHGTVYQCNRKACVFLDFNGEISPYKIDCFYKFKKRIDSIDLIQMAENPSKAYDFEIIASPCPCEKCYVLTLPQIVALKELLDGAKVMLELNSILYERLYSVSLLLEK